MKRVFQSCLCLILVTAVLFGMTGCTIMVPKQLLDLFGSSPSAAPVETTEATEPTAAVLENPVPESNPYRNCYDERTGYVMAESHLRYYFRYELLQVSETWLTVAKNEIYARKGYIFEDGELAQYFSSMPWYNPSTTKDPSSSFNKYEKHNNMLLGMLLTILSGKKPTLSGKYLKYYDYKSEYIVASSNKKTLDRDDLRDLSKEELKLARNEIFARHGYYFSTEDLLTYFAFCSWYEPNPSKTTVGSLNMKSLETKNVNVIQDCEKNPSFSSKGLNTKLNYTVKTSYFSVKLPAYWKDACTVKKGDNYVYLHQKKSYNTYGGWLFDIILCKSYSEMYYYPDCTVVGTLASATRSFYVVVVRPTDVQYDDDIVYNAEQYAYMMKEYSRIIKSIKGLNGYTFNRW